jgi:hypothetical protein
VVRAKPIRSPVPAPVSPFEHLSVLISIIIGLGLTHLLASIHRLVQARDRVTLHWLPLLWVVLIFITQVEWWWASFGWRNKVEWNFFYFLFILLSPVSMYLSAAFVLPDVEAGESYDLKQYYFATRRWLFLSIALGPAVDAVRRAGQAGSVTDFGALSNAVSAVLVGSMAFTEKLWYHVLVTLTVGALFLSFIVSSALELR